MTEPMSAIGQAAVVAREGNKLVAYLDSVGVWTIGIGHTVGAGPPKPVRGMRITLAESLALFAKDHLKYLKAVDEACGPGVVLKDHQRDALGSLCYNIGEAWFTGKGKKYEGSSLRKALQAGNLAAIPGIMLKFSKPAEIVPRRQAEADQFETPYETAMPRARRGDAKRISAPAVLPPASSPVATVKDAVRPTTIAGKLADIVNVFRGGTPNVTVAFEKPPGFNGNDAVFKVQAKLREKGFTEVGKLDGWAGDDTRQALRNCIRNNGENPDDLPGLFRYNADCLNYVSRAKDKAADPLREVATTKQVQQNAPEVMRPINTLVNVGMTTLFGGGAMAGLDSLKQAVDTVKGTADTANSMLMQAKPVIDAIGPVAVWLGQHPFLILMGLGALCLILVGGQTANVVQLFREKRII